MDKRELIEKLNKTNGKHKTEKIRKKMKYKIRVLRVDPPKNEDGYERDEEIYSQVFETDKEAEALKKIIESVNN